MVQSKALQAPQADNHNERGAFFALAGQTMKRLLIQHARPLAQKVQRESLWEELQSGTDHSVVEVEHLLTRLGEIRPVLRQVVEMKVFEGLTAVEIAAHLQCAEVTVRRYWQFSRHWLAKEISG